MTPLNATDTTNTVHAAAREIVFVDSRVQDSAALLQGLAPGVEVVYLRAGADGLQQMAAALGGKGDVGAVHILAHGSAGQLWLGSTFLDPSTLNSHADALAAIGRGLSPHGDLLVYSCDLASGNVGAQFVARLADLTGAVVAASNNRTGAGGDWTLEVSTGHIDAASVLSPAATQHYDHSLATLTVTSNADSGAGSLRNALASATAGDTITFSSGMTVTLNSQLIINKNLIIDGDLNNDGVADVTLDGQYKSGVLNVTSGNVTLDGLVITHGLIAGNGGNAGAASAANSLGAGISNFGNLTLDNVSVTANSASGGGGGGGVISPVVGGAGGGGGAVGGGIGGHGGSAGNGIGNYAGGVGTPNRGGTGGSYNLSAMSGHPGSSVGATASVNPYGYSNGSAGGTAASGSLSIGGGGGGAGWNTTGGKGGSAAGGIYNASSGTLTIIGTSTISGNIGAGGGGGGGSASGSGTTSKGGDGGLGVGAIWNKGAVLITGANFAALGGTANTGASGTGGLASASVQGNTPSSVNGLFNDVGATANTSYAPNPVATVVVATPAQHIGSTSQVTITFSAAVNGFSLASITAPNGTLSNLTTSDNTTWTATFTPASNVANASSHITVDNTTVTSVSGGSAGTGTSSSNSYTVDTVRPTAAITVTPVSGSTLSTTNNATVSITFSEAVSGFSLSDMTAANGTLSNLTTSDNIHWTATLTPTASNNSSGNVITLDNTLYTDTATNAGTGTTTSNTYAVDTVRPTASILVANNALNIGGTSQVTIAFSKAVSGLTAGAFTVADGTLSGLSSSDGGTTWTATLTPSAGVSHTGDVITLNSGGASDAAGNTNSGTTNSNSYAVDTQRPTASIVFATPSLHFGQTSLVTITFSEAVTGFTNAGLTVANGTLSAVSSSDGGVTWTATFTPAANITNASNLITLDNTGVSDAAGNAGSGTTNSNNYAIDTQRPTASIVVANTALAIGQTSLVTITFSEKVTGLTNAGLSIANGTLSAVSSSDGGMTWTATFTPTAGISNTSNLITLDNTGVADLVGNAGTGTTSSNNYAIDTQRPTATIVLADSALTAGKTSLVTITFSEAVTGFTNADLNVPHGTLSAVSSSDGGITWSATFTPTAGITSASNVITLTNSGVADLAGNAGAGTTNSANFTINTVAPTATIVVADNALKVGTSSLVTITFSEAVTGFSNAALTVANGTLSTVSSSDGGVTWTATLTPTNNITAGANQIVLDNTGVHDLSGNAGVGSTSSNNYAIDTQRPTATIAVANAALAIGQTSLVTITFSEKVTGFTNAGLSIANGTLSAVSSSDGGMTWTATFTPTAGISNTSNLITLDNTGVTDLAGNAGSGTTSSNNYTIDTQRPTATIVLADSALTAGKTSLVTITFSEAVTGFTNADLAVPHGTLSAVSSSDGGITWSATFTPTAGITSASNVITLTNSGVADLAGNAGAGTTNSANFTINTVVPTATIVVAQNALKVGDSSLVTITFSEAVTGFTNAALTVAHGTLSAVSSSDGGITWTATLTPTNNITAGANQIVLDNTGIHDLSGNAGTGSTASNNYAIDTQRPTATIAVTHSTLEIGDTSPVTITFSEKVTGFTNADLHIDNGTLSAVTSSDGGMTWTATFTPTAGIDRAYNLITLNNSGVTDLAGNTGSGTTSSNNYVLHGVDHTPPPIPVPSDNDNIPDAVENLVPGLTPPGGGVPLTGDGNGDGILDSKQADVASLPVLKTPTAQSNPAGAASVYVTLVAGSIHGKIDPADSHAVLNNVHQLDAPANLPVEIKMPVGLIAFTATVQNIGTTENFSLYVDPALPVNGYWKMNAAGTWVNLASAAYGGDTVLEGGKLRLDFHITDGGEFDADGKADGIITESGAAGFMPLSIVGYKPELPAGGHFWF